MNRRDALQTVSAPGGNRTPNLVVRSHTLYPLSYGRVRTQQHTGTLERPSRTARNRPRLHAHASDAPPGIDRQPGNNISISLSGEDADELRGYWEKLSMGGTVTTPLEKQMWGDEFGQLVDKFGISWMVNIGQAQQG